MNINAPGGTQAPQAESDREKIDAIKAQIEEVGMRASVLFSQVLTGLPDLSDRERRGFALRCPELEKLLQLGSRGQQTAIEYFFNFEVARIEGGNQTPSQKLEEYRKLLTTFEKIADEAKKADAAINGTPL